MSTPPDTGPSVVVAGAGTRPDELLDELGLAPGRPVLVVAGGAATLKDGAHELAAAVVGPAVAHAVSTTGAAVVDGGTATGIMAIVGDAVHELDGEVVLVGVAPEGCVVHPGVPAAEADGRVELDRNHTHFALAASAEWGGETPLLIGVSEALARGAPIVMVVAGGGTTTRDEVLQAARRGWPIMIVAGTGGTADELAAASKARAERADAATDEIVRRGDLRVYGEREPGGLARRLAWALPDLDVLRDAWRKFATYDALAASARKSFERLQSSILLVGIVATLLALVKGALDNRVDLLDDVLHWSVVALPILAAVLIGMAQRLASGKRWVLLRAAAETIKREIYRFRTGTGVYREAQPSRNELLAARLDAIESKPLQTEASSAELTPYAGPLPPDMYGASRDDDGLSPLGPDRYLALRVGDQLSYYHPKVARLAKTRRRFQFAALGAGAAGAILAAAGLEVWIGLTTAIASAALAYLGYLQVESTLVAYNQSAGKLEALRRGWLARSRTAADDDREAFDELVAKAEAVLETELGGWVQQMNDALEELQTRQSKEERRVATPINTVKDGVGEPKLPHWS